MAARFGLDNGSGPRVGRWFARALTLAGVWPLGYGLFGGPTTDWDALLVGMPVTLIGVTLWTWAGYRSRNPSAYLEIDRDAGLARLCRGPDPDRRCALDELGAWTIESWKSTSVHQGTRSITTWHAARCAGFGGENLFVDLDPSACRRWCAEVDAAARPFVLGDWQVVDAVVDAVLARHALHDRDALLWTATGLVADGARELDATALAAAAQRMSKTSLADRIGHGVDRLIDRARGTVATIGLLAITGLIGYGTADVLARSDDSGSKATVAFALVFGLLTLAWRAQRGPVIAAAVAAVVGAAMLSKPWIAPVRRFYDGAEHVLSPTSETHLYAVLPGLALLLIALGLLATVQVRKPAPVVATKTRTDAIDLPRPKPPGSG